MSKASDVIADNLSIDKVVYKNMNTPIIIICRVHNLEFTMKPQKVLISQNGCPDCSGKRLTTRDFIRRATLIHSDRFNYDETEYTKMTNKVTIKCIKHDSKFSQLPQAHLKGSVGCMQCNGQSPITLKVFLERANNLNNESFFDYSLIEEKHVQNMRSKVNIICINHDVTFSQEVNSHLRGTNGCPKCNHYAPYTPEKVSQRAQEVYPLKKYDYTQVDYTQGSRKLVTIGCYNKEHGFFKQTLDGHFSGRESCRKCNLVSISKREMELADFVKSLGFEIVLNDRSILKGKEIDIYIPALNIGIEFNGLYWHSETFKKPSYHADKFWAAKDAGVRLIQVWEDDWLLRELIVKNHIRSVLGVSNAERVFARKTEVVIVSSKIAKVFLDTNHIQGFVSASHYVALRFKDEIVALAGFTKSGSDFVLSRYASSKHVVGGHSKIVSYFEKNFVYEKLITFADLTFSDGDLYRVTGWTEDILLRHDYSYVWYNVRAHKFGFRKKRFELDEDLLFNPDMTESELALLNNIDKIWDAGKIRFIKFRL